VKPGERLLDVGTGPGILIPYLRALVGRTGSVCAFDLSLEMVRQAYQKKYCSNDIIFQADVNGIPFRRNVFDRVICFAAFPHFNDSKQAIQEMGRVLKPGGCLIIAHLMSREELANHHSQHESVSQDILPDQSAIRAFFTKSNFSSPEIVDMPGKYMASAFKI
jgi:ubiquinone/menaquinone biosynthesis C-methylase UbiE